MTKPLHQRKQFADDKNKTATNCNYDIPVKKNTHTHIYIYIHTHTHTGCFTTLGLCDQKSSYKHVSDFGRLWSYDRLKLRIEGNDY